MSVLAQKCLKILDEITSRSISDALLLPFDSLEEEFPEYTKIVKNPIDFEVIRKKIDQNIYKSFLEFKSDMNLVWSNCLQYFGEESFFSYISNDLKAQFDKISSFVSDNPEIDWINELYDLCDELGSAIKASNNGSGLIKKKSVSIKQFDTNPNQEIDDDIVINQSELKQLADDIHSISDPVQQLSLLETFRVMHPKLVGNKVSVTFNLNTLPPSSIIALQKAVGDILHKN